jgi:hypothetical protein
LIPHVQVKKGGELMAIYNPGDVVTGVCGGAGCAGTRFIVVSEDYGHSVESVTPGEMPGPSSTHRVYRVRCEVCAQHHLYNTNTGVFRVVQNE